jgi:cytochrome c-type biogenesis protein
MIDIVQAAVGAVALRSGAAPALVFAAGSLSCFGPCVAPRLIAVAACGQSPGRGSRVAAAAFIGGLCAAYSAFGALAGVLGSVLDLSYWAYGALAAALSVSGAIGLVRAKSASVCTVTHRPSNTSLGAIFFFGAASALTIAPCCAPVVSVVAAYAAQSGDAMYGAALLAVFALGHGLPAAVLGLGAGAVAGTLRRFALHQATAVATAALCIVLSAFYWCLA